MCFEKVFPILLSYTFYQLFRLFAFEKRNTLINLFFFRHRNFPSRYYYADSDSPSMGKTMSSQSVRLVNIWRYWIKVYNLYLFYVNANVISRNKSSICRNYTKEYGHRKLLQYTITIHTIHTTKI